MSIKTKVVRDGNSWAVRLPKVVLGLSGIKPGSEVQLVVKPNRIVIYSGDAVISDDKLETAKQDVRQVWDEAFEQVWLDIFGVDEG